MSFIFRVVTNFCKNLVLSFQYSGTARGKGISKMYLATEKGLSVLGQLILIPPYTSTE